MSEASLRGTVMPLSRGAHGARSGGRIGHLIDRNAIQELFGGADPKHAAFFVQNKQLLGVKVADDARGGDRKNRYQLLRALCRELLKRQALNTVTII